MAGPCGQKKGIKKPRLDAVIGVRKYPHLLGDLIRHLKSHAGDIIRQTVGIFPDNTVQGRAVLLVNLSRKIHGYAVVLKEHHGLAHVLLFLNLLADGHSHLLADSLDLCQPFGLFLQNAKGIRLEPADNPGCQSGSDTFYGAGAKIALHGLLILGKLHLAGLNLELLAVYRMLRHNAAGLDHISFSSVSQLSHHDDFLAVTLIRDAEHRISIVLIAEFYLFYKSCNCRHGLSGINSPPVLRWAPWRTPEKHSYHGRTQ